MKSIQGIVERAVSTADQEVEELGLPSLNQELLWMLLFREAMIQGMLNAERGK